LLSESAVETLDRNSLSGLVESEFAGDSFSTSVRYFFASVESPDLIADIKLDSALSKELPLLEDVLDVEDVLSSANRELVCKLEINMNDYPFW